MSRLLRILVVDDSEDDAQLTVRRLAQAGFQVEAERVETEDTMNAMLGSREWDLVICDYAMPRFSGPAAIETLKRSGLDIPALIVSGTVGEESAVLAMKAGASDYLRKGSLQRLPAAVERELREAVNRAEARKMRLQLDEKDAQLRQAQKMEAIGRLAGGIAHDFSNVLAAIALYCDSIACHLPSDAHRARDGVDQILKAQERAAALTRQLLAFGRKKLVQPRVVDVGQVAVDLEKMLRRLIGENIELRLSRGEGPLPVLADPSQVEQVLLNLVVNARDAMPGGGSVTIGVQSCAFDAGEAALNGLPKEGAYVRVEVRDTGVGMDASTKSRIFEPFFTTKEVGKGTGLGLSVTYGIAKQCGGNVVVESEIGQGATFYVYLPQQEAVQPGAEAGAEASLVEVPLQGGRTLLLVEDNEQVREMMHETLSRYGFEVLVAATAVEAEALLGTRGGSIDLLATDVVLPGKSGIELAQHAKAKFPGMGVLFLSGYAGDVASSEIFAELGGKCIEKPFTAGRLLGMVREALPSKDKQETNA